MIARVVFGLAAFGIGFLAGCHTDPETGRMTPALTLGVKPPQESEESQEIFKNGGLVCTPELEAQGVCEKQKR
jgi:hypothetical protein